MTLRTLNDIFFAVRERTRFPVMLERQAIDWVPVTAQEFSTSILGIAAALRDWGIARTDRVAILSENRHEWCFADLASLLVGAVVVPIYSTLTAEQTAFILNDSGARLVFVSTAEQLQKVLAIRAQAGIERIVVMDGVDTAQAVHLSRLAHDPPPEVSAAILAGARDVQPSELATLIYTSGTTGVPKGVALSHGNMASNIACSLGQFGVGEG